VKGASLAQQRNYFKGDKPSAGPGVRQFHRDGAIRVAYPRPKV